jgi:phytoene dehydrogenase-like protein
MASVDYVVVGGGINGLVAAAMLGKKGRKVLVLERNDRIGGCLRTEEVTAPGFDQFFVWRPFAGSTNHRTAVPDLYHIGASTHPGPGLGGGSGYLLANTLT